MYCSKCKIKLTSKNTSPHNLKIRQLECRQCSNRYYREHVIDITRNRKQINLHGNKRPYPKDNKCEICNKVKRRLSYHHWNDKDISKGIWCCPVSCHIIVEAIDKFGLTLIQAYLKLKEQING